MSKTVGQILLEVHRVKTCSPSQLYRYFKAVKIEPVAARQRPQRYPDDAAERILDHLGFGRLTDRINGIPEMPELRRARAKARRGK